MTCPKPNEKVLCIKENASAANKVDTSPDSAPLEVETLETLEITRTTKTPETPEITKATTRMSTNLIKTKKTPKKNSLSMRLK